MSTIKFKTESELQEQLNNELNDLNEYLKSSARDVSRLIRKYSLRAVFGNPAQPVLDRDYTIYSDEIAELHDLEHLAYLVDRIGALTSEMGQA